MGAMRDKNLSEWGNGNILETVEVPGEKTKYTVLNWDGSVSPVVHQYDRHKELSVYFYKRLEPEYRKEWKARKAS